MRVVVDTNIWSLALRRLPTSLSAVEHLHVASLADLVRDGRVLAIGIVRQEVLSGVPDERRFAELREALARFPDEPLHASDHVRAAEMYNLCRTRGVQCASIDILLCAVAERLSATIFTTDADFDRYAGLLPIQLFRPRA